MPSTSPHILDVGQLNFAQEVVERSRSTPVLVDFWAEWCGPCKALTPILEKLAVEYGGAFTLAKVNTESEPELSQAFGITSIPSVKLVKDGALIDEFAGALPEAKLREFLERHVGPAGAAADAADTEIAPLELAREALAAGDPEQAAGMIEGYEATPDEVGPLALLRAEISAATGDVEATLALLDALPADVAESSAARGLRARLSLGAIDAAEVASLTAAAEAAPDDLAKQIALGRGLACAGEFERALEQLLDTINVDREFGEGAARKAMVEVFDAMGDDERVHEYRRRLQMALFV